MSWLTIQYEPPPLYFMHIRKTAGTVWHDVLKVAYPPQAVTRITVHNFHRYSLADLGRFRAFWSHCGPGLLPCIAKPGMVYITMLRDPIEQFVSQLYFKQFQLKRGPGKIDSANAEQVYRLLNADLRTLPHQLRCSALCWAFSCLKCYRRKTWAHKERAWRSAIVTSCHPTCSNRLPPRPTRIKRCMSTLVKGLSNTLISLRLEVP